MIHPLKTTVLAAAVAATTLTAIPAANANPATGWAIAGGVAAGALLVGALTYPYWGQNYVVAPATGVEPLYAPDYAGTAPLYAPDYAGTEPLYAPNYAGTSPMYSPDYGGTAPLYGANYVGTAPLYGPGYVTTALQAWSPEWYQYCEGRYRTFNARTGTFTGNDGRQHFCGR